MIKVLHINAMSKGGAAICAQRICTAVRTYGVVSRMLVAEGDVSENVDIVRCDKEKRWMQSLLYRKVKNLLIKFGITKDEETMRYYVENALLGAEQRPYYHLPYSNYKSLPNHPLVREADIIHLHWVAGMIDYPSFFSKVKKPIVWTMHDMHPMIGLMHYESQFTQLPGILQELDIVARKVKRKSVCKSKCIHIVAISDMMKKLITTSDTTSDFPCTLIHNGVDTTIFKPTNLYRSENARKKIFLFSSYLIWDSRKGLQRVIDALENISLQNKELVVIGRDIESRLPKASFPIICTGEIEDQAELAKLYTSADFFINASYEEAFAQTPLESMACGTPVISTPCSGASDLIKPFNGIVCRGFDKLSLAEGIERAIRCKYDSAVIRQYIVNNYDYRIIGKQYVKLYENLYNNYKL